MDIKISKKKHSAVHNKVYPKNSPLVFNLRCKMEIYLIFTLCSQFITASYQQMIHFWNPSKDIKLSCVMKTPF